MGVVFGRRASGPAVLLVLVLAGCGASPRSAAPAASTLRKELSGSPRPLAALHAQGGALLAGGPRAFAARLASLRGYEVVVNKWASWCGPCQSEFPVFQQVSAKLGRRVAFVGIDGRDSDAAAASFLRRFPLSYPSYTDPAEAIARSLQASTYYPETLFFSPTGRMTFLHAGPYESAQELERDVRRYAGG